MNIETEKERDYIHIETNTEHTQRENDTTEIIIDEVRKVLYEKRVAGGPTMLSNCH